MDAGQTEFTVELPLFTGPFRLLADLLLDQKIDVCDVAVAEVTAAFLRRGAQEVARWDLDDATWFLAVCALLLELKVGRLLPRPGIPEGEEDLLGEVSPDLLYARSRELAAFRRVAQDLAEVMAGAARMVPRSVGPPPEFSHLYPDVMERVDAEVLRLAAATALAPVPDLDLSHVTPIRVTLDEAIDAVKRHLSRRPEALFRELLSDCEERIDVVVRFLALLELYREGQIELLQARVFGDIEVRRRGGIARPTRGPRPSSTMGSASPHSGGRGALDRGSPSGGGHVGPDRSVEETTHG